MRAALLLLLGLVIGILGTAMTMNALNQRNPLPKAVMTVMAYHMSQLQHAVKSQTCDATQINAQLQQMQSLAHDIKPAFAADDPGFNQAADVLQSRLDQANQAPHADCPALAAVIKPVHSACSACHQTYR